MERPPSEECFLWFPIYLTFPQCSNTANNSIRPQIFIKQHFCPVELWHLKKRKACVAHTFPPNTDCDLMAWLCGKLFQLGLSTEGRFQFVRLTLKKTAPTTSDLWQYRLYHTSKWRNRGWVGLCFYKWSCADGTGLTKRQEYCLLISVGGWGQRRGKCDITHKLGKVSNLLLKQAKYLLLGFCFYPSDHWY